MLASCGSGSPNIESGGQIVAVSSPGEVSFFAINGSGERSLVLHNLGNGNEEVIPFTTQDPTTTRGLHAWSEDGNLLAVTSGSVISVKNFPSGKWEFYDRHQGNYGPGIANFWSSVFDWVDGKLGEGFLSTCVRNEPDYSSYPGICFTLKKEEAESFYQTAPEDSGLNEGELEYSWPSSDSNMQRVAFIRQYLSQGTPTGTAQLILLDTTRDSYTRLEIGSIEPFSAKISPNGKQIAFLGDIDANLENGDLWIIDLGGGGLKKLTTSSRFFDWSENGQKIVFEKDNDIWVIQVDSGNVLRITNTPNLKEISPTFRPNH